MATKRKRDYKAEYARRIAKAMAAGKTRQQARGHKPKEHVVRARKSQAKYGASPSTMTRLRKQAYDRVLGLYNRVAKNPVSSRTVHRGMRMLHADDLWGLVAMDDVDVISAVKVSDTYLDQLSEYFPASMDAINDAEWNPLWYHR